MPTQNHPDEPRLAPPGAGPAAAPLASPLSRRSVLRGAAGVSAAGLAAAAGAGALFAATRPADAAGQPGAAKAAAPGAGPAKPGDEPLVVYLRDTSTGEFDVFNGTSHVRIRDPRLVAQLLDGLQTAQ